MKCAFLMMKSHLVSNVFALNPGLSPDQSDLGRLMAGAGPREGVRANGR